MTPVVAVAAVSAMMRVVTVAPAMTARMMPMMSMMTVMPATVVVATDCCSAKERQKKKCDDRPESAHEGCSEVVLPNKQTQQERDKFH